MTSKLVVIVNSLKVPKIKKNLLCDMKFLVSNYNCLQNPWLVGYRPQIPVLSVLCPQLIFFELPRPKKIPGNATIRKHSGQHSACLVPSAPTPGWLTFVRSVWEIFYCCYMSNSLRWKNATPEHYTYSVRADFMWSMPNAIYKEV